MQEITVIKPVFIRIKVTQDYQKKVAEELQEALDKVENQIQQMDFQFKRIVFELEKKNPKGIPTANQQLEREKVNLNDAKQKLVDQLNEINNWKLGQEVTHGQLDSLVKLKVGDNWRELMKSEIVLQDGIVVEIR